MKREKLLNEAWSDFIKVIRYDDFIRAILDRLQKILILLTKLLVRVRQSAKGIPLY